MYKPRRMSDTERKALDVKIRSMTHAERLQWEIDAIDRALCKQEGHPFEGATCFELRTERGVALLSARKRTQAAIDALNAHE